MPEPDRILLFGGTFDPIHNGHLIVTRAVAQQLRADRIILIPSADPPHKQHKVITPAHHRLSMVRGAVADDPLFEVSDCELNRPGPSYTLLTVRHLRQRFVSGIQLYWQIGVDMLLDLPNWYQVDVLLTECTIVTAARPGWTITDWSPLENITDPATLVRLKQHILDTPLVDISATDIRRRVAAGSPINELVPPSVQEHIARHGLYQHSV